MNKSIAVSLSRRAAMAVAGIAALTAVSVNAQTTPVKDADVPAHTVGYQDLDLSERADTKVLYSRLRTAAEEVCNVYAAPRATVLNKVDAQCKREAIAKAVAAIGHPNLTALHTQRGGMKLARVKSESVAKPAIAAKSGGASAASGG